MTLDTAPASQRAERYAADGMVQVDGLLDSGEAETIRSAFMDQVVRDRHRLGARDGLADDDVLARFPRFMQPHRHPDLEVGSIARRLMTDPRLLGIVTELIGPAFGAQSMFYFKPPSARGQALHQDNYFLRAHPETCIAAWIAIDDCDAANGALSVVPGSHTMEVVCPETADDQESFTTGLVRPPAGLTTVQTVMRAGDVLFFHGSLVHGSLPNTTEDRFRMSLIFHYVPQTSVEIAQWYLPLVAPDGSDVTVAAATGGGPCGNGWPGAAH
ncbi:phytanoyl-CoA dioxygenase family protein [Streptomyces sp. NBC_01381]|uniref:phytanoyl-CoA dioxygenase family protein n=1 Tax=Streptomyces sp. NBC_01381 TaxID=2903845 RepID=UPI002250C991|nr:phytanoyl-CoA dioxygenase family protein [Streptomyces sp. NBC_01381]MCX4672694.1 phytanoyl-CoA dioxygenase family protein [Streptomyces sp. NBC_01381]